MKFKFQYKRRHGTCEYKEDGTVAVTLPGAPSARRDLQRMFEIGVELLEPFSHPGISGVKRVYHPISCPEDFITVMKELNKGYCYWIYELVPKEAFGDYKMQKMYHAGWYGDDGFELVRWEDEQGIGFVVIKEIASSRQAFYPFNLCYESEEDADWLETMDMTEYFPEMKKIKKLRVSTLFDLPEEWCR